MSWQHEDVPNKAIVDSGYIFNYFDLRLQKMK